MSILFAAAVLPLVAIGADDERLKTKRTFVSEEARMALSQDDEDRVLCLDRKRERSICLTESQWNTAIALAEQQPRRRPHAFIPELGNVAADRSSFSLGH